MEKEFISYEQAVALKELGYREKCAAHYPFDEKLQLKWIYYSNMSTHPLNTLQAPLKQQVFRWFRELYGLHSYIEIYNDDTFDYVISSKKFIEEVDYGDGTFNTFEEAENALINRLIEFVKQQDK